MQCPDCGYEMGPFEAECERCKRLGRPRPEAKAPPAVAPPPPPDPVVAAQPVAVLVPSNPVLGILVAFAGLVALSALSAMAGPVGAWALVIATCVWIGIDAGNMRRGLPPIGGMTAGAWLIASLFLWIIGLPWYVVARDRHARQYGLNPSLNGLLAYAGVGVCIAIGFSCIMGFGLGRALLHSPSQLSAPEAAPGIPSVGSPYPTPGPQMVCPHCHGAGSTVCHFCNGAGNERCAVCNGTGSVGTGPTAQTCPLCGGQGQRACVFCNGTGRSDCPMCTDGYVH